MQEVPGGRGEAHFVAKTKCCGREYNVSVITSTTGVVDGEKLNGRDFSVVATLEVRGGAVPVGLEPGDGWTVQGPSQTFSDQHLGEDLAEYDEEAGESVSLMTFKSRFELTKEAPGAGGKGKK
jgi:Eukaryotic protein of unknown function (DUF866)